jgi:thymidylate synthase ThyX
LRELGAYFPDFYGTEIVNKPGMQATDGAKLDKPGMAEEAWAESLDKALQSAEKMLQSGVHKQHASRILEPFMYTKTVVTATEWQNFFMLRTSKDAQPEFRDLALKMQTALEKSTPVSAVRHLPYVEGYNSLEVEDLREAIAVSAARCARVSYFSFATQRTSHTDEDVELARRLAISGHLSPFDHCALMRLGEYKTTRFNKWVAVRDVTSFMNSLKQ